MAQLVFQMENQIVKNVKQKYVKDIAQNPFHIKKLMILYQLDMIQEI